MRDKSEASWQPSDPDEAWDATLYRQRKTIPIAEFRLVGVHSIDFHVVSALWMLKVGHRYDAVLDHSAYANRLRRTRRLNPEGTDYEINPHSLGSLQRYIRPFAAWRDNGLRVMRDALDQNKRVVAITADVRQFYHKTSPDFLLDDTYLRAVGLEDKIGDDEREFTRAIIEALHAWAAQTPLHRHKPSTGLPVGLPAARLIANVSLAELDRVIRREVAPLYYGRYVDDIPIVLANTRGFKGTFEVWDYICRRSNNLLKLRRRTGLPEVRFVPSYLSNSEIVLAGDKPKIFLLEGLTGTAQFRVRIYLTTPSV